MTSPAARTATAATEAELPAPGISPTPTGPIPVPRAGDPRLDVPAVTQALLGSWPEVRRTARERARRRVRAREGERPARASTSTLARPTRGRT